MTSIGIGGLIVGNAGAEEPGHSYATDESGVSMISPVAPLEKSSSTPTQSGPPSQTAPGSEAPEIDEPVPASPRSVEESAGGSVFPTPARPTQVPSEPRPTGVPSETPSDPGESPSEPSESPSESPTESPSEPSGSPSEPTESPSDPETGEPDPSGTPTD